MKLKLADNLPLPLDFATERIAYLARTGAGKSGGMRVEFEQFVDAGIFSIFVDPKGDAWGIRAEGKGPGKPVLVIGGDHGDIPLEPTGGKVIAEFLMRERVSCVIDISDFSTTEMWRFMAEFTKTAYKINRDVCHLFIDEVDMLAGQQYFDPHCLHGIQLIQNKGRNRGWGVTIASQRPQMVNLTVLNASGTYIVMQTIGDDGLKVVRRILGAVCSKEVTNEILSQLPTLQTREAFVYSPQLLGIDPVRIRFGEFQTYDSMRTPKPGERRQAPKSLADINLEAVRRDMADTIEKVNAEDPKKLQAEIRRLTAELAKKPAAVPAEPIEIEVAVFPTELEKDLQVIENDLLEVFGDVGDITNKMARAFDKYKTLPANTKPIPKPPTFDKPTPKVSNTLQKPVERAQNLKPALSSNGQVSGMQSRILQALAELQSFGVNEPSRLQVSFYLGNVLTGGSGATAVGQLNELGYISIPRPGVIAITDAGISQVASIAPPGDLADFHSRIRGHLKGVHERIFNQLIEIYPSTVSRTELGKTVNAVLTGGSGATAIGDLRTAGLLTIPQAGYVRASDILFPEGLN